MGTIIIIALEGQRRGESMLAGMSGSLGERDGPRCLVRIGELKGSGASILGKERACSTTER